jgi:hypothetical protein
MKVKAYRGARQPQYTVLLPVGASLQALPADVQASIAKLGPLQPAGDVDLAADATPLNRDSIAGIRKNGYYFWKTEPAKV